jgi:hypothetical protein
MIMSTAENQDQIQDQDQDNDQDRGPSQTEYGGSHEGSKPSEEQAAAALPAADVSPEVNVQALPDHEETDAKSTNPHNNSKLQALSDATSTPSPSLKGWSLPNPSISMLPTLSLTSWFSSDKKIQQDGQAGKV